MKEFLIADDNSAVFERQDIQNKVKKLDNYIRKTNNRLQELDKKLIKIHAPGASQDQLKKGMAYYQLNDNISSQA